MGPIDLCRRLRFSRCARERALGLVGKAAARPDNGRARCGAHFDRRNVSVPTR